MVYVEFTEKRYLTISAESLLIFHHLINNIGVDVTTRKSGLSAPLGVRDPTLVSIVYTPLPIQLSFTLFVLTAPLLQVSRYIFFILFPVFALTFGQAFLVPGSPYLEILSGAVFALSV